MRRRVRAPGPQPVTVTDAGSSAGPGADVLEKNIVRFVQILRRLGVPVNPAETLDGLAALELVDLADRSQVKTALKAALVKSWTHQPLFDLAFDLFFLPPEQLAGRIGERRRAAQARQAEAKEASAELRFQDQPLHLTREQLETYTRLADAQQERLMEFLAESSAGNKVDSSFRPLIESIVKGHLDRWRRKMNLDRRGQGRLTGDETLDTVIEGTLDGLVGAGDGSLLHVDMKDIAEADVGRATRLIRRLARRLATRLSRRYRESYKRRRPNIRRTIRANIKYGGALFDLRYRERKIARPRLLLICDVSGSMARYTAFILEFILGLAAAVSGVEAFVFSEELERVSERLNASRAVSRKEGAAAGAPGGSAGGGTAAPGEGLTGAAAEIIGRSRVWGKGTDLGAALDTLFAEHERLLTRDTVVIIVSDTKTLSAGRTASLLARMRLRVKEILWLNTLPREQWEDHRTVGLFARHTNMHECYTLAHLERVIRLGVGRHFRPA